MANEKNLVPFTSEQSHEEAVKNGRKGGFAVELQYSTAASVVFYDFSEEKCDGSQKHPQ